MNTPAIQPLQFGPRQRFRNPSGKIIRLTIQLFFVIAIFMQVSRPAFWASLFGDKIQNESSGSIPGTALIDPSQSPGLASGMILAQSKPEKSNDSDKNAVDQPGKKSTTDLNPDQTGPIQTPPEDLPFLLETLTDLDRDLPPALYYHFLDKARKAQVSQLISDARRDVTFSHLYRDPREDPKKYRGQLVQVKGTVRRALAFDVPPNAYGLTKRYELWIFTEDSGKFPWVVELTDLPPGFPLGSEIQEKVESAGFFLKLWAYRAQDGFRSAPLLLGHGLNWQRTELVRARFERQFAWAMGLFLSIFLIILIYRLRRWRLDDQLSRQNKSVAQLTNRLGDLPDKLDLTSGVFPEQEFDYIVHEDGSKSVQINHNDEDG